MLERTLEPEVMDSAEEALDYDDMDHAGVNAAFCTDALRFAERDAAPFRALDLGTGTALIPIELCKMHANVAVVATDLATHMIEVAGRNVAKAGLSARVTLVHGDVKTHSSAHAFDLVLSNSVLHHIPEPRSLLEAALACVDRGGVLFVRDLERPRSEADVSDLADRYTPLAEASAVPEERERRKRQRDLFEASLRAALTLSEARALAVSLGLPETSVQRTSDRHLTLAWKRA